MIFAGCCIQQNCRKSRTISTKWGQGYKGCWGQISGGHGQQTEEAKEGDAAGQGWAGSGWLHPQTGQGLDNFNNPYSDKAGMNQWLFLQISTKFLKKFKMVKLQISLDLILAD